MARHMTDVALACSLPELSGPDTTSIKKTLTGAHTHASTLFQAYHHVAGLQLLSILGTPIVEYARTVPEALINTPNCISCTA
jgi:hypothetical protein